MKMASRSIHLISKKKIARVAHFFLISENKFARTARFLTFFAVVLRNYNAALYD